MDHEARRPGTVAPVREFGAELTEHEWSELTRHGHRRRLPTASPLFLEGTRSDTVVLVISGRVKVFCSAADGAEVVLAVRGPGALLGELAAKQVASGCRGRDGVPGHGRHSDRCQRGGP